MSENKKRKNNIISAKAADFMTPERKKIIRIVSFCILAAVMLLITVISIPLVKMLATDEGRAGLEKLVSDNYFLGLSVYLFLQALQVVVALIPGGVIQILGGVLFGNVMGTIWCVVGILLGEMVVFKLARRFGMPVVEAFVDKKGIKKFEFLNDSKKLEISIFILFLIPGIPKDVLTYLAPLTRIRPLPFFVLSMLGRMPAIILSTVMGANLGQGNIFSAVVVFVVFAVIGIVGIIYSDKVMNMVKGKRKESAKKISKKI